MENFKSQSEMLEFMESIKRKLEEDNPVAKYLNEKYKKIEEELPEDMKNLASQHLLLFGMMLEEAEKDPEFATQMLLPYKTWNRLSRFMDNLARPSSEKEKNFRPRCAMVDSFTILSWVREYYALDDREDYEKELREKEEAAAKKKELDEKIKQRRAAAKKKTGNKETTDEKDSATTEINDVADVGNVRVFKPVKDSATTANSNVAENVREFIPTKGETPKKSKRDCNGQLDFFGMLQD